MPIRLDTVLRKVEQMPNKVNSDLLEEFYQHMKDSGTFQNYQKGNLKAMIHFAEHIGAATSFFDVDHRQVLRFLDKKIKSERIDPDKKWITTMFTPIIPELQSYHNSMTVYLRGVLTENK